LPAPLEGSPDFGSAVGAGGIERKARQGFEELTDQLLLSRRASARPQLEARLAREESLLRDEVQRRAQADFEGLDLLASDDRQAAVGELATTEVIIGHHFHFDEAVLASAPRLRWIQSLTSGTDALLKLRNLPREVIVTNTRGMHGPQVSELVFLQMLALLRDFPRMQRNQAAARWERWPQPLLLGKTVVIVGVGAIAEVLALRCKAFGMTVHGVSGRSGQLEHFDGLHDYGELTYAATLADFLVLLVPLSPATEKLADVRMIAAMKPGAYLINVARGGVLDEDALLLALRERRLAGAALDVYRTTPCPPSIPCGANRGWYSRRTSAA